MEDNRNNLEEVDIIDVLLDEDNTEPIYLSNANGQVIAFEQIAVIPYKSENSDLYAILKPLDEIPGMKNDEAVVVRIELDDNDKWIIVVEQDETTAVAVFDQYYKLIEESGEASEQMLHEISEKRKSQYKH